MKNIRNISAILLLALIPASGVAQKEVRVENFRMTQSPSEVIVDFLLHVGKKIPATGSTLTLTPTLMNEMESVDFTPVVVRGRRAEILDRRSAIAAGRRAAVSTPATIFVRKGESVKYRAVVPFEDWMPGAALVLKGESEGCTLAMQTLLGSMADDLLVPSDDFTVTEEVVIPGRPLSTAEKLARRFPFVQPAPADGVYDDVPQSSRALRATGNLAIYVHQAKHNVIPDYRDNYRSLVDLLSVIEEIRRSDDSEVDRIVIMGFSSPEGTHELNLRLSERRAEAMRRVIERNSPEIAERMETYGGGEDWDGLRELVAASEMPSKEEVLRILDTTPTWDTANKRGRESELMKLQGGTVYRHMLRTMFSDLREATFIVVYYKNKAQQ
jgi:hypothetical protein